MFAENHERRNSETAHIVSLESVETPPMRSSATHRRSWRDLVARPDVHALPWHAVEIGPKVGSQNQILFGTLLLKRIRGPRRWITNRLELHDQVYAPLITEMAGGDDAPHSVNNLFFVKKIYDSDSVTLQPMPFLMYVHGESLYQRITDQSEIDYALIRYIGSKASTSRRAMARAM